eukprot:gi/632986436/ref/XP_007910237.1/ PREDICTED: uncharacterized protein LOC103191091 [Callorhinchus milii]
MGLKGTSLCLVLAAILIGLTQGDSVTQKVASVTGKEGGSVTMECHYDTSLSDYYLNWYREQQETQPHYVLQKGSDGDKDKADFAKKRFSIELQTSTKFTSLTISLLELSDSAVYYCALEPHSDVNQSETHVFSAKVKQTPSSISREECESLTINCVFSASYQSVFKSMEFYRRFPNERDWKPIPREGRFVVKTDKKSWSSSLEINNLQVEDSADYYCKARYCWSPFSTGEDSQCCIWASNNTKSPFSKSQVKHRYFELANEINAHSPLVCDLQRCLIALLLRHDHWLRTLKKNVFSAKVTQTPSPVRRQECESLTINCVFSASYQSVFQSMEFYRRFPNERDWKPIPREGRFVVKTDMESWSSSLEINVLQVEDSADYYCKARYLWRWDSDGGCPQCCIWASNNTKRPIANSQKAVRWAVNFVSVWVETMNRNMIWTNKKSEVRKVLIKSKLLNHLSASSFICDRSSYTVSQSPPEQSAFSGERINVHCQYSGFCGQNFSVSWYRQTPGEGLKYLLHRKPSGEGVNPTGDHISASLDTAKKISVLTIADLRLTDSALYHCALSLHHSDTHHRKPRTITLITTKAGKQYSAVSDREWSCGENFSVSWYRQSPGEELKYLLQRNPSGEGGNPTGDHISASLDTAKKISVLTIADLRLTDSAMYHCALSLHHSDHSDGASVSQNAASMVRAEGETVNFQCAYATTDRYYHLYLYRHYPDRQPEFFVASYSGDDNQYQGTGTENRFSAQLRESNSSTSFSMSVLVVSDSAVYHCALSLTTVIDSTVSLGQKLPSLLHRDDLSVEGCAENWSGIEALRIADISISRLKGNHIHLTSTCQLNFHNIICHSKCRQPLVNELALQAQLLLVYISLQRK